MPQAWRSPTMPVRVGAAVTGGGGSAGTTGSAGSAGSGGGAFASRRRRGERSVELMTGSFVDLLADDGTPRLRDGRRGYTEGTVTALTPFTVQLDDVTGTTTAKVVGATVPAVNTRVLILEIGAGVRYCLGRIQ